MAKSAKTKIFNIGSKQYRFNYTSFKFLLDKHCKDNEFTKKSVKNKLAKKLCVSEEAIHNWEYGYNGPSTLDMIKNIGVEFSIDYFELLEERKEVKVLKEKILTGYEEIYSDLQLMSIKKIYDLIILFLREFEETGGFTTSLWYEFLKQGFSDPEEKIYEYVEKKISAIEEMIMQEYFYLHNLNIYDRIQDFVANDLREIYENKLGYAYRFEAIIDGNPTTSEDYYKALGKINTIIKCCNNKI
jgi:transcriptional regulator with XRE-family HTH domain